MSRSDGRSPAGLTHFDVLEVDIDAGSREVTAQLIGERLTVGDHGDDEVPDIGAGVGSHDHELTSADGCGLTVVEVQRVDVGQVPRRAENAGAPAGGNEPLRQDLVQLAEAVAVGGPGDGQQDTHGFLAIP